jgi:hypothetical protein
MLLQTGIKTKRLDKQGMAGDYAMLKQFYLLLSMTGKFVFPH